MYQSSVVRLGNASIIGVSSLDKQSDLDYRMHHRSLCNTD